MYWCWDSLKVAVPNFMTYSAAAAGTIACKLTAANAKAAQLVVNSHVARLPFWAMDRSSP
jgi:hypothetical protein